MLNAGLLLEISRAPIVGGRERPSASSEAGEMAWAAMGGLEPGSCRGGGEPRRRFPKSERDMGGGVGRRDGLEMGGQRGTAPLIAGHVVLVL